jgi:hypothetical protein
VGEASGDTQRRITEFLRVLALSMPAGQHIWTAQVQDPEHGDWRGQAHDPAKPSQWREDCNLYFACASMVAGATTRSTKTFGALLCAVLDDVGTKVPLDAPRPEPSWIVETSPGNFQYGYLLRPAVTDVRTATRLIGGLVSKGVTDAGADGIVRYFRLPGGVNSKRSVVAANGGKPWVVR